jgi:hypothetical protein
MGQAIFAYQRLLRGEWQCGAGAGAGGGRDRRPQAFVAIVKIELGMERGLNKILQILNLALFEKNPVFQVLSERKTRSPNSDSPNQRIQETETS